MEGGRIGYTLVRNTKPPSVRAGGLVLLTLSGSRETAG